MASRVFGGLCTSVFLVLGTLLVTQGARPSDRAGGVVSLGVSPLVSWLVWWRPYLVLTEREVVVQNALTAFAIPLERVGRVEPGGYGIVIEVRGRARPVMAMAVLQANISTMLRRQVRADVVAREIAAARDRAADEPAAQV